MSQSKDAWEAFGIRIGPFGIDINSSGQAITHTRTETSHLLQIRLDPAAKKETIKVRLVRPGLPSSTRSHPRSSDRIPK